MNDVIITESENGVLTIKCPGDVIFTYKGDSAKKLGELVDSGKLEIEAFVNSRELETEAFGYTSKSNKSMTKDEKNREIAKILGFKFHEPILMNGFYIETVEYPKEWTNESRAHPRTEFPDFIEMLEQGRQIRDMFKYGLPYQRLNK